MGWKGFLVFLGIFAVWFTLTRWVLPMCGIETCCSSTRHCCSCGLPQSDDAPANQEKPTQGETP